MPQAIPWPSTAFRAVRTRARAPISRTTLHVGTASTAPKRQPTCSERRTSQRRNKNVNDTKQSTEDLAILEQLNKDFFHSDQFNDVKRFSEFLAEDFISQFP